MIEPPLVTLKSAYKLEGNWLHYVGKGTKDRVLAHEKETRAILKSGRMMRMKHKHKVIHEIWKTGYDVVQQIVYRTDDEQEAYAMEYKAIDDFGLENLTNATYEHRPRATSSPRR